MKFTLKEISPAKREIEVTLPVEEVGREFDRTYHKIGQKANLKGFRPGKIPRAVLEQHFREDAESEVIQNLVRQSYPDAIEESGLIPASAPEIRVVGFGVLQDFSYQASVEIRPVFDVKGYEGIRLKNEKIEVTQEEIQDNLKALQERVAQLVPVTESRRPHAQDVILIDYEGFFGDRPIPQFKASDFQVEIGKNHLFPELEAGVMEMTAGEKKRIQVTYPADWADRNLAGKGVNLAVHLKDIKEKRLPEIDDDLAKDLGSFASLDELKAKIREEVIRNKEQSQKADLRRQVVQSLVGQNDFEVPEGMIHEELEDMIHQLEGSLKGQGVTLEQAGITHEDFFEKSRPEAVLRIKGALIFDAVAEKEGIQVTEAEIDQRIDDMARLAGQSGAAWKRYYEQKNMLGGVQAGLREEKTLDFILSKSTIK